MPLTASQVAPELPDKVEQTLASMRALERAYGEPTPLLVHTDLKVVDERLAVLDESFWRFQRIHPRRLGKLGRVLMQNFATGCTVMLNRALATLALPIPAEAMMHDWWLALVVTAFGRVGRIPRAKVLYRQHGGNDVGVSRWIFLAGVENLLLYRDRRRAALARQEEVYLALERQAEAFAARFGERLPPAERAMLRAFGTMHARGFLGRRRLMLRYGFLHSDRWENFMMLLR